EIEEPLRSAAELVAGLESTWQMIQDALAHWTPADLEQVFQKPYLGEDVPDKPRHSRQWIIWHLLEHDLHHGGELSLALGMHGLTAIDL
ncbi:MAG: DinB family protein, partial [Ktedonobacteraceae bacterium]